MREKGRTLTLTQKQHSKTKEKSKWGYSKREKARDFWNAEEDEKERD